MTADDGDDRRARGEPPLNQAAKRRRIDRAMIWDRSSEASEGFRGTLLLPMPRPEDYKASEGKEENEEEVDKASVTSGIVDETSTKEQKRPELWRSVRDYSLDVTGVSFEMMCPRPVRDMCYAWPLPASLRMIPMRSNT